MVLELVLWRVIQILSTCYVPGLIFYVFWSNLHKSLSYKRYTYTNEQNESSKRSRNLFSVILLESCNIIIKTRFALSEKLYSLYAIGNSSNKWHKYELYWGTKDQFHYHFWYILAISLKNILWNRFTRPQQSCAEFVCLDFLQSK